MNCIACGKGPVETRRESHRYSECGLDTVTLQDIEVRHCRDCGETEWVTPDVEGLHALIASVVASKPERLLPQEIRYLRKYLGHNSKEFSRKIGVRSETVSRWESVEDSQQMDLSTERFLRLMVFHERPASHYPQARLEDTAVKHSAPRKLRFASGPNGWQAVVPRGAAAP
jgi:putative zinc finger/helix-turn-helix YgiT family protein